MFPSRLFHVSLTGFLCLSALAGLITGCSPDAVVVIATPESADAGFLLYEHPTGIFSLRLPPDWAVNDLSAGEQIYVEFSPPGAMRAPLSVYVVNTGAPITSQSFGDVVAGYQSVFHAERYAMRDTSAQADGSWRVTGTLHTGQGDVIPLNTFFQRDASFFSALEVEVDSGKVNLLRQLDVIIDTFRIDPEASVAQGRFENAPAVARAPIPEGVTGVIGFDNLYDWNDAEGGFRVNGQVVNRSGTPLEHVRINAKLFDAAGVILAEQGDFVQYDVLLPGENAPFSVRFDRRPPDAVRYELHAAARHGAESLQDLYAAPDLMIREDEAGFNEQGYLTITGTVANMGGQTAHFVKVIVTVFDDEGRVVSTDTTFIQEQALEAGASAPFRMVFFELGGPATRYIAVAQGQRTP